MTKAVGRQLTTPSRRSAQSVGVPEEGPDRLRVLTLRNEYRHEGVTKVVEPHRFTH